MSSFQKRKVSEGYHSSSGKTHAQCLKNLFEVQPPGDNHFPVVLRVKASRYRIPFAPLDQVPLNICYRPVVERILVNGLIRISFVQLTMSIDLSHRIRTD